MYNGFFQNTDLVCRVNILTLLEGSNEQGRKWKTADNMEYRVCVNFVGVGSSYVRAESSWHGCAWEWNIRSFETVHQVTKWSRGRGQFVWEIMSVCFLADRTVTQYDRVLALYCHLPICLWCCELWCSGLMQRVESYTIMFLGWHFLFTFSRCVI